MLSYEKRRILIWGKTEPEPSTKYVETVCTGGVLEDGSPVRLYPIPLRYLDDKARFHRYQWITARIAKDDQDHRPESYKIDCDSIEIGEQIPTGDEEWLARARVMFQKPSWQFDSVDDLVASQEATKQSIGVVTPREIVSVAWRDRPPEDGIEFVEKRAGIVRRVAADRRQSRLFEGFRPPAPVKRLEFTKRRIQVTWVCGGGKRHAMQIMDWEAIELARKVGEDKTIQAIRTHLDLSTYAARLFLGNIKQHPTRFTIVGLWYPKRRTKSLFDELV
jgi:hypothetical protein